MDQDSVMGDAEDDSVMSPGPGSPDDLGSSIHPLQAVVDRVGRQAERFAEQLEKLNPAKEHDDVAKIPKVLELAEKYQAIAASTVKQLRAQHGEMERQLLTRHWRERTQGTGWARDRPGRWLWFAERGSEATTDAVVSSVDVNVADLQRWQQEEQTWSLFRRLIEHQSPRPWPGVDEAKQEKLAALGSVHRYSSDEKVWARFMLEDDVARERRTVVRWLQDCAEISGGHDLEIITNELETAAGRGQGVWSSGWLQTKETLKAMKRGRGYPRLVNATDDVWNSQLHSAEQMVTQLDPDAPNRESKKLQPPDDMFDRCLWIVCWQMFRRGRRWAEIRDWLVERAEHWRAVSLMGDLRLGDSMPTVEHPSSEDSVMGSPMSGGGAVVTSRLTSLNSIGDGYSNHPRWRRMCWARSQSVTYEEYERAVYGMLAGDLESVLGVCHTRDDVMYAHYNALLLSQFERYVKKNHPDRISPTLPKMPILDYGADHANAADATRRLMEKLNDQEFPREATPSIKKIQVALISKDFRGYAYRQGVVLSKTSNADERSPLLPRLEDLHEMDPGGEGYMDHNDVDGLRMLCHMLFLFQDLGLDITQGENMTAFENIIVAYIDILRLSGKLSMVPLYASRLRGSNGQRLIHTMAMVLLDVTSPVMRKEMVGLMHEYEMDISKIISSQVQWILTEEFGGPNDQPGVHRGSDQKMALEIMESTNSALHIGRMVRKKFIGTNVNKPEDMIISAVQWYMQVEGCWTQIFEAASMVLLRLLSDKRLAAAQAFVQQLPSSEISLSKSKSLLGKSVDIFDPNETDDDEDDEENQAMDEDDDDDNKHEEQAMTREVMIAEAKMYRELENLVWALVAMEKWREVLDQHSGLTSTMSTSRRAPKSNKTTLQQAYEEVDRTVRPLFGSWLIDVPKEHEQPSILLRRTYLPSILLSFIDIQHTAGHLLNSSILLDSMTLSTVIALPNSEILGTLKQARKLKDVVRAFAKISKAILREEESETAGTLNKRAVGGSSSLHRTAVNGGSNRGSRPGSANGNGGVNGTGSRAGSRGRTGHGNGSGNGTPAHGQSQGQGQGQGQSSTRKRRGQVENWGIWHVDPVLNINHHTSSPPTTTGDEVGGS
ncbi:MAG: hypothetical protein M1823_005469 [Watsoniomyces obsoletus]|nr:MAG: hypothetical protein M1823_005469 [Watsoniomyces obsoletus]